MARRFSHVADIGPDHKIPYSPTPRPDRGKWAVVFPAPGGKRKRTLTTHDIRGKNPPAEFHDDAKKLIKDVYFPPSLFPSLERKTWDVLLSEVEKTSPHTRPETFRSFRASIKAVREILPDVVSPVDVSEDRIRRFTKLWLAAPNKQHKDKPRSPVTLSYYLRGLSAFTNHLIALGYVSRNPWHGVKVPKGERAKKPVPTEQDTSKFFTWVHERYPDWKSLHSLLELKAVSACRTADVCRLRTRQLRDGVLTFGADIVKTKESRSLPIPTDLYQTLTEVTGKTYLWEKLFWEIPKYRKTSNGLPDEFSWKTVYHVVNNIFREFNDSHPDQPRFTPHALRRRAITLTVGAVGSVDAAASAIGVHPQTARTHYLDAKQAFDTDEVMRKVAEALRPKIKTP